MIGRLGGKKADGLGMSFKGAGLYYLHDKDHAKTNERVGETHTINLNTNDPQAAINAMAATAMNQKQIKEEAGTKSTGRKLSKPVFTYSLSWHAEDKPTAAHMVEQAKETLKALGFSKSQALIVQHLDTDHPHVHVVVNRINPQTGLVVKPSFSKQKLSQWAKSYEETHGVRCAGRFKGESQKAQEVEAVQEHGQTPDNENVSFFESPVEQETVEEQQAVPSEVVILSESEPTPPEHATLEERLAENYRMFPPDPPQELPMDKMPDKLPQLVAVNSGQRLENKEQKRLQEYIQSARHWMKNKLVSAYLYLSQQQNVSEQSEQQQNQEYKR